MIPPGHGEPDDTPASLNGRGSNTYTDEDWDCAALMEVRDRGARLTTWAPAREEIEWPA